MKNIVLCGFMGCGKSTVGRRLAALCDLTYVDMDQYIEEEAGCSVSTLFENEGEEGFRRREHAACVTLGRRQGLVIATGGGAVLREENVRALAENGTLVWLKVDAATVLARLANDTSRPLLARPDKEQAVRTLLSQREPLYKQAADRIVDGRKNADAVADAVLQALDAC